MEYATDPELKQFSLKRAADAAGTYNDLAVDAMSREHKFFMIHAAPGIIATNWGSDLPWPLNSLIHIARLFANSIESAGEFMSEPLLRPEVELGTYLLQSAVAQPVSKTKIHDEALEVVWKHTKEVLDRVAHLSAAKHET